MEIQIAELGLTDINRTFSDVLKKESSDRQIKYLQNNEHPRGFQGRQHTKETRQLISIESKAAFANMTLDEISSRVWKMLKTKHKKGNLYQEREGVSWKMGWREIGGVRKYYRSQWEANYARYLEWLRCNGEIESWQHEPDTFWFHEIKRGVRSYLPDFKVTENSGTVIYHEVKGWMDARSATKIKRMAEYYPDVELIIIDKPIYKSIENKLGRLIPEWE